MKYFYLTAEGTTAGPESLDTLCGMIGSGTVHLGTLVVPAGGEDWTPLARVLRFFYADAAGGTAGPVVFSELYRLHQVAALQADAWVMEEKGSEWKVLSGVLTAAGVDIMAPPPSAAPALPRTATGAYRPPAVGKGHSAGHHGAVSAYAAPHAPVGKTMVRHRATGGMGRLPFIGLYILMCVVVILAIVAFLTSRMSLRDVTTEQAHKLFQEFLTVALICQGIVLLGSTVLMLMRNRNIGWPWPLIFIPLLPTIASVVAIFVTIPGAWFPLVLGLLSFASLAYFLALLILPPGYARHRRLDTAAKVISGVIVFLVIGTVALVALNPGKPAEAAVPEKSDAAKGN